MRFKKWFFALSLLTMGLIIQAQFPNPNMFNTGVNSVGTGVLPLLNQDLHWTAAVTSSVGTYMPGVVVHGVGWASTPATNADWICFPHTCSATPTDHSCETLTLSIYYKLIIDLPMCTSYTAPNAYCVTLNMMADNCVKEVFLNGVSNYQSAVSNPRLHAGFTTSNQVIVNLCNNWQPGTNTVIVHVISAAYSNGGLEGFWATATQTVNAVQNTTTLNVSASSLSTCVGSKITFTAANTGGTPAYTYSWSAGPSTPIYTVSHSNSGNYIYTVTSNDANGCANSKTVAVSVSKCTNIDQINGEDNIEVFPNPTNGLIKIRAIEKFVLIEIYNPLGVLVYLKEGETAVNEVDLSDQPDGIYFVRVSSKDASSVRKIVKE